MLALLHEVGKRLCAGVQAGRRWASGTVDRAGSGQPSCKDVSFFPFVRHHSDACPEFCSIHFFVQFLHAHSTFFFPLARHTGGIPSDFLIAREASLFQSGWVKSNISNSNNKPSQLSAKPACFRTKLSVPTPPHLVSKRAQRGFLVYDFAIKGVKFQFFPVFFLARYIDLLKGQSKRVRYSRPIPYIGHNSGHSMSCKLKICR